MVSLAKVGVQNLAVGYRASKVAGSSVIDEAGETIGKIDNDMPAKIMLMPVPLTRPPYRR